MATIAMRCVGVLALGCVLVGCAQRNRVDYSTPRGPVYATGRPWEPPVHRPGTRKVEPRVAQQTPPAEKSAVVGVSASGGWPTPAPRAGDPAAPASPRLPSIAPPKDGTINGEPRLPDFPAPQPKR